MRSRLVWPRLISTWLLLLPLLSPPDGHAEGDVPDSSSPKETTRQLVQDPKTGTWKPRQDENGKEIRAQVKQVNRSVSAGTVTLEQGRGVAGRIAGLTDHEVAAFQQDSKGNKNQAQGVQTVSDWVGRLVNGEKDKLAGGDAYNELGRPPGSGAETEKFWADSFRSTLPDKAKQVGGPLSQYDYEHGDYATAYKEADAAIEAGDRSARNFYFRGASAEKLGDKEQAHADASEALRLDPGLKQAESLFKLTEASKVGPVGEASKAALGRDEGDGGQAGGRSRRPLSEEDEIVPDSIPKAQFARSRSLTDHAKERAKVGDLAGALDLLKKSLALNPEDARAYHQKADIELRTGDLKAAAEDASRLLDVVPGHAGGLNMRALANNRLKDFRAALGDAEAAMRANPGSGMAHYNRAYALAGLGRRAEALAALKRAAELDPQYRRLYERLAGLPADADASLVFVDGGGAAGPAGAAAAKDRDAGGPKHPPLLYWVLALIGCGFAGFAVAKARSGATATSDVFVRRQEKDDKEGLETRQEIAASGVLGRYSIVREIAAGGMGVVYEGFDEGLRRKVAIKRMRSEIRADQRERERFLAEARTVAALRHPNIVEIYSIEDDGRDGYLVFEYVEGVTLREMLGRGGRFPLAQAQAVFSAVCSGLDYAHGLNVVHRDLKPANIMMDGASTPKIMDFGVARQTMDAMTRLAVTGTVCGTPAYMAPEQEQGRVGRETDIYALGVSLYELLTERLPFEGTAGAAFAQKLSGKFSPASSLVPGLPPSLDALLAKALDPEPGKRHRTAREFAQGLSAL